MDWVEGAERGPGDKSDVQKVRDRFLKAKRRQQWRWRRFWWWWWWWRENTSHYSEWQNENCFKSLKNLKFVSKLSRPQARWSSSAIGVSDNKTNSGPKLPFYEGKPPIDSVHLPSVRFKTFTVFCQAFACDWKTVVVLGIIAFWATLKLNWNFFIFLPPIKLGGFEAGSVLQLIAN